MTAVVDLPRVRAALAALDALIAAHPELRDGCARLAAMLDAERTTSVYTSDRQETTSVYASIDKR